MRGYFCKKHQVIQSSSPVCRVQQVGFQYLFVFSHLKREKVEEANLAFALVPASSAANMYHIVSLDPQYYCVD